MESSDSPDQQVTFTDSHLWKLLDRHGNTIRLMVLLPEQSPGTLNNRTAGQNTGGDLDASFEGSKANRKPVEAILEESTEKLKSLSFQQQQGSNNSDGQKSSDTSEFEHIESPTRELDSSSSVSAAADNRELEDRIQAAAAVVGSGAGASSDPDNQFACEERSDSEVHNDRSTSSVDSDILSSSHSSDTLCNADSGPIQLANGLDSHSITSSRRSKAHEGKKETWDTAEEDSGTDSEYDDNGKSKTSSTPYMYFRVSEPCAESSGDAQKCTCFFFLMFEVFM